MYNKIADLYLLHYYKVVTLAKLIKQIHVSGVCLSFSGGWDYTDKKGSMQSTWWVTFYLPKIFEAKVRATKYFSLIWNHLHLHKPS